MPRRREDDNAEQVEQIGPEEADEGTLHGRTLGGICDSEMMASEKPPLIQDDRHDDGDDAEQHDNALNEVKFMTVILPAANHIDAGDHRHADDAHIVGQREGHAEQTRQTIVDARGVRDEEHEDDVAAAMRRARNRSLLKNPAWWEACRRWVTSRARGPMDPPGEQRANDSVADAGLR